MKATLSIFAAATTLILSGCADNGSNPISSADQTVSSLQRGGANIAGVTSDSDRRGRRDSLIVKGMVTAVDTISGTVTLGSRVIQTDLRTKIERNEIHVRLSALQVGDRGEARLLPGSGIASSIETVGDNGGEVENRIEGPVTAVDVAAGTVTIGATVVQTNTQTIIERNHVHVALSAIQVGDRGEARIPAGSTVASKVQARG